jgi:glycosyltransferase involved in cell wall biosynthesis
MSETKKVQFDHITIGMITLNREQVIGKALESIVNQTYPHNKLFVLIVDGESNDHTVARAQEVLDKSDIPHKIMVRKSNCAEARNICIENMVGDSLLFWDSDVWLEPTGIYKLIDAAEQHGAHVVTARGKGLAAADLATMEKQMTTDLAKPHPALKIMELRVAPMSCTLIHGDVIRAVRFDDRLDLMEDADFTIRAREKGFRVFGVEGIHEFDLHLFKEPSFSAHATRPLSMVWRGLRTKAKAKAIGYSLHPRPLDPLRFLWETKRYAYYLGHIPMIAITIAGLLLHNVWLALVFPCYLLPFAVWQVKRRGWTLGAKATLRSLTLGTPIATCTLYYLIKCSLWKEKLPKTAKPASPPAASPQPVQQDEADPK